MILNLYKEDYRPQKPYRGSQNIQRITEYEDYILQKQRTFEKAIEYRKDRSL